MRAVLRSGWMLSLGTTIACISFGFLRWRNVSDYDTPHSRPWNVSTDFTYESAASDAHSVLGRHIALIVFFCAVAAFLLAIAAMQVTRFALPLRVVAAALAVGSPLAWLGIYAWASRRYPAHYFDHGGFTHELGIGFWGFTVGCLLIAAAAVAVPTRAQRVDA